MPGVYEGGLKVWEASLDLVEYLLSSSLTAVDSKCGDGSSKSGAGLFEDSCDGDHDAVAGRRHSVLEVGCVVP